MSKAQGVQLGKHIHQMVRQVALSSDQTIKRVEIELAEQIGVAEKSFQHFYYARAHVDLRVIKVLLERAATCDRLDRAWGERLVYLAGFAEDPQARGLLDEAWPPEGAPPPAPAPTPAEQPAVSNLPPPTCARFVMRPEAFAALREALAGRSPAVFVEGMGGIGKTSLAREVAERCLAPTPEERAAGLPQFDAALWVSDKDHPGDLRLSHVLDLCAELLGRPELTGRAERRQREVEQLLRARRVLLVIDNLETVADPALFAWLPTIPAPSKALVTTRKARPDLEERGIWRVELRRMSDQEGREFVALHSRQIGLPAPDDAAQEHLIAALGGNPKAMAIALGLAKRTGRPVAEVLRGEVGDHARLLADLVAASWAAASPAERRIAQALCLFPASVEDGVLARVAGVERAAFYAAIQQLADLSLVEQERRADEGAARRVLHPVTRQFVEATLRDEGLFVAEAQARRIAWAVAYAEAHGGHRANEPAALARIEAEEPALWDAFLWVSDRGPDHDALTLARRLEFYYYTRASWGRNRDLYARAIRAARRVGNPAELSDALALLIQMLSRQGRATQAQDELAELIAISRREQLRGEAFFRSQHAQALAHMALGQLDTAAAAWGRILAEAESHGVPERLIGGTLHWLALCRHAQGARVEAWELMERSLALAEAQGNTRRVARNHIALAHFALDDGRLDEAAARLGLAARLDGRPDDEQRAHTLYAAGRLHAARGDLAAARPALAEALALFERMGMEPEVRGVRAALDTPAPRPDRLY